LKWLLATDANHLATAAAQIFLESVAAAVSARQQAVVALSGGATPKRLFEILGDDYHRTRIPWDKLHIFWVDERCVPPHHPDSNYGVAKTALFSKVSFPESHLHRIHGEVTPPSEAARAYESELKAFFKIEKSLPVFDLITLGLGEDGHTASLFPGTEALLEKTKWVAAPYVEKLSAPRITLTLPVINAARKVLFMVEGAKKAAILREVLPEDAPQHRPAQRVRPENGELIWLFDRAAASELPNEVRFKANHLTV
jgi:6-phosphogluconolactonase